MSVNIRLIGLVELLGLIGFLTGLLLIIGLLVELIGLLGLTRVFKLIENNRFKKGIFVTWVIRFCRVIRVIRIMWVFS